MQSIKLYISRKAGFLICFWFIWRPKKEHLDLKKYTFKLMLSSQNTRSGPRRSQCLPLALIKRSPPGTWSQGQTWPSDLARKPWTSCCLWSFVCINRPRTRSSLKVFFNSLIFYKQLNYDFVILPNIFQNSSAVSWKTTFHIPSVSISLSIS